MGVDKPREQNIEKLKEVWDKVRGQMLELFSPPKRNLNHEPDMGRRRFLAGASAATFSSVAAPVIANTSAEVVGGKISVSTMQKAAGLLEINASYDFSISRFISTLAKGPQVIQDMKQVLRAISGDQISNSELLKSFLNKKRFSAVKELVDSSHFLSRISIDDLKDEELTDAIKVFVDPKTADTLISNAARVAQFMENNGFKSLDDVAASIRHEILESINILFKRANKDFKFATDNKELLQEMRNVLFRHYKLYLEHTVNDKEEFQKLYNGLSNLVDKLYDVIDLTEFKRVKEKSIYNDIFNILYSNSYAAARNYARHNLGKQIILRAEGTPEMYAFESKKGFEFGKVFGVLLRKSPHKCVRVEVAERLD